MHPIPPPSVTVAVTLLLHLTTSFSSPDGEGNGAVTFPGCDQTFHCGPLRNLFYPFSGGSRPSHCGLPEFRLACTDSSAEIAIGLLSFRVLRVDPPSRTMAVARSDLWNQPCPSEFTNTTLGSGPFIYGAGNADLSMFYRCNASVLNVTPENQFRCDAYSLASNDSYFLIGPIPFDPILKIVHCSDSVRVPIQQTIATPLTHNRSLLGQALMEGFNVNFTVPFADDCSKCVDYGGHCGFDSSLNEAICICGDRVCSVPDNKKGVSSTTIGISVAGAFVLAIIIGGLIYMLIQRKKKKFATLAKSKSRDLSTPPSSKGNVVPSTNFSQTTPSLSSYNTTFSKSDVEKGSTYFGTQVFSYVELQEATDNFDPSRELGEGGFGTVYYGKLRDGREVAVKRLYENNFRRVEQFMNEVEILTRLQHHNLVKLYGCTSRRSRELLLVYEFIPNGTVADHLHGKDSSSSIGALTWPVRLSIAVETADALSYLHRSDIIHRDVKTNNILLDGEFRVKVADFGLSKLFPTDVTHVSTAPQGTPGYVDPEYYQCYQLTTKSDVYSFGVVLTELISSLPAVDTSRHRHDINLANMAVNKVQNHLVSELVDPALGFDRDENVRKMVTDVAELAFRCLQQERDMRPTMEEVSAALREIRNQNFSRQKPDVVDIKSDDVGLLKHLPPPLSPDSVFVDKWISNSTTPNSC